MAQNPLPPTLQDFGDKPLAGWRLRLYTIIFEADTRAGRWFDKALIVLILVSIAVVMADSVQAIHASHGRAFAVVEWIFTLLFTAEYLARLVCVRKPLQYATSFFGIIDLIAVLPTYLALFFPELRAHRRARAAPACACSVSSSWRPMWPNTSHWAGRWPPAAARSWCFCRPW